MSREIANSGYGLLNNGLVLLPSPVPLNGGKEKLRFLSNIENNNAAITEPGEDVTYFLDPSTQSILRYDANGKGVNLPQTSIIINRVSAVEF